MIGHVLTEKGERLAAALSSILLFLLGFDFLLVRRNDSCARWFGMIS